MTKKNWLDTAALVLAGVGAINWGLHTLNYNLVRILVGSWSRIGAGIVYWLVAVAGAWTIYSAFKK